MGDENYKKKGLNELGNLNIKDFFNGLLNKGPEAGPMYKSYSTEETGYEGDSLEDKAEHSMDWARGVASMIEHRDYATALFALENNLHANIKTDALYGALAMAMTVDLNSRDKGSNAVHHQAKELAEQYIGYCKDKCGYFNSKDETEKK